MKRIAALSLILTVALALGLLLGTAGATGKSNGQSFGSCQNSQHPKRQKRCNGPRAFGYFRTTVDMRYTFCVRVPDLPNGHRGKQECVSGQQAKAGTLYANRFFMKQEGTYTLSWYMQLPQGQRTLAAASGPATLNGMPQLGYAQITRVR